VLWPGAAAHLASAQGLGMAVLEWHLMGTHGLSAGFTVDAGCKAFPVSAFMLFEARRSATDSDRFSASASMLFKAQQPHSPGAP
jgi:hypothetical protein